MTLIKAGFNSSVAKEVGTDAAIILHNIQFWIKENQKNKNQQNFKDEKYWVYNSVSKFTEVFNWLSEKQIRTRLNKLVKKGYLLEANYNKNQYDRTKWYTLTEKSKETTWQE